MARPVPSFAGRHVLVTGGARGIGRATAARFARAGARVVIGDRDLEVAQQCAGELGGAVRATGLDVTDASSWAEALAFAEADGRPLDVLVNNAGIMPLGPVLEEPDEVTEAILAVNVRGVILGTKVVGRGMAQRGRGHVVNVASAVGRVAMPHAATYSASKHAVVGFTEAARAELAEHGVEVSMVLPTVVRTELAVGVQAARGVAPVTAEDVAEEIAQVVHRPRAEVWVPRWTQGLAKTTTALPRLVQEGMARALGADQLLARADSAARADYEARARR